MAVESLLDRKVNIKEMQISGLELKPISESQQIYNALKDSVYDQEKRFWNPSLAFSYPHVSSSDQLAGILVEGLFDKKTAQEQYENLKQTEFYDEHKNQWNDSINYYNENVQLSERNTTDQILSVLVEGIFDKKKAKKQYDELKQTPLYDEKNSMWLKSITRNQIVSSHEHDTADQLLGVLVVEMFDPESAGENYEQMKESHFYDKNRNQWEWDLHEDQMLLNPMLHSGKRTLYQLLGVLAESKFNKDEAREQYNNLKESPLYDKDKKTWIWTYDEHVRDGIFHPATTDQLLGIIVEHTFESRPIFGVQQESMPEVRRF